MGEVIIDMCTVVDEKDAMSTGTPQWYPLSTMSSTAKPTSECAYKGEIVVSIMFQDNFKHSDEEIGANINTKKTTIGTGRINIHIIKAIDLPASDLYVFQTRTANATSYRENCPMTLYYSH